LGPLSLQATAAKMAIAENAPLIVRAFME